MNLAIDIGNSFTKCAIFEKQKLVKVFVFDELNLKNIKNILAKNKKIKSVILSSVVKHSKEINKFLSVHFNFTELTYQTFLPIKNLYQTKETLGNDRIAAAVAANAMFPNKNVLIIDIGTCIKYDFVNNKNEYLGGGISPGLLMRFKALNNFTDKLPLHTPDPSQRGEIRLIGNTTEASIRSGVQNGMLAEIIGIIGEYENKFKNLKIILAGGDTDFFERKIKKTIFADPHLVLKGLNLILNFNEKK